MKIFLVIIMVLSCWFLLASVLALFAEAPGQNSVDLASFSLWQHPYCIALAGAVTGLFTAAALLETEESADTEDEGD